MPEYHAWTHAPKARGGTDPIPRLGALESGVAFDAAADGTTSVNNNTLTTISFDNVFVSAGATAIAIEDIPAPATTTPLQLIGEGWYVISFSFKWASVPVFALFQMDPDFPAENMASDTCQVELGTALSTSVEHSFGPLYFHDFGSANTLRFKVHHTFGSSRAITAVMFTVVYLGPDIDEASFPLFV